MSGADSVAPVSGADTVAPVSGADRVAPVSGADKVAPVSGADRGETAPLIEADEWLTKALNSDHDQSGSGPESVGTLEKWYVGKYGEPVPEETADSAETAATVPPSRRIAPRTALLPGTTYLPMPAGDDSAYATALSYALITQTGTSEATPPFLSLPSL